MKLNSLKDLYIEQLQDLYSAEQQLVQALPKMESAASDTELKRAMREHLAETKDQVDRLERVLESIGEKPGGETCKGMKGLISEGQEALSAKGDARVLDGAIMAAAQRVEHYEIAGYGTAIALARALGRKEDASQLELTLEEERDASELIHDIALQTIRQSVQNGDGAAKQDGSAKEDATYEDLYERARTLDIRGRSSMNKKQLAKAIEREN